MLFSMGVEEERAYGFTYSDSVLQTFGANVVVHPIGYGGAGGTINVTVGIDPASPFIAEMEIPVQNAVTIWNTLIDTRNNIKLGNIPLGTRDFETSVLHEMGHALGWLILHLDRAQGFTNAFNRQYTRTTKGVDGVFNLNLGMDTLPGTKDDLRGDDLNVNWFCKANNNPFILPDVIDASTCILTNDLPAGHLFRANANFIVAGLLGIGADSQALMHQTRFPGEDIRTLSADDTAGIRYGMTGIDEIAGTADDHVVDLSYAGLTAAADIVIGFDPSEVSS